ncbi:MAG: UDP-glucose 4-epimerase GalE [Sulfuricurvum sp.]|uniref:UDP-glucose 4-epimerase GalE n=2 Tax=Sulfuricurvum sp. TaxID=2025608 RepID=UPI0026304B2C|nr:UDP-glucose 4-epimerase GalE [Sulfuricurvum sp.]MDD4883656.1 UDP-glucose 4-epimerase GalE [Sulfuricurvum sp.]
MKILITGGAGYIGSHVVKQFLEKSDHDIIVLDNLSTGHESTLDTLEKISRQSGRGTLRFYRTDLADFAAVEKIFLTDTFDALIHFAASIVVPESVTNPLKYYMNNTVNTTNLIRLCHEYGVTKMIFSSTAAVYGEPDFTSMSHTDNEIKITENMPTKPINPYGMSKLMSETVIRDTAAAYSQFKYVILRYFNVAGADIQNRIGQSFPDATHLIKVAVQTAIGKKNKLSIFGDDYDTPDGTCIRDYIHVEDLASAHIRALGYLDEGHESDIFNCGYGHGFSVREVIESVKKVSGADFTVEIAPRRPGDPALLIADNTKIKNALGWQPQYDDLSLICKTALEWEKKI